jgi:hypothetical protein
VNLEVEFSLGYIPRFHSKIKLNNYILWYMPVIPAIWRVEAAGLCI